MTFMKGNLVKTPLSEINATLELLATFGVSSEHLEALRKNASWNQRVTAEVIQGDPFLMALLALETNAKDVGFNQADFASITADTDRLRQILSFIRGFAEIKLIEYAVDCNVEAIVPSGYNWTVEEHRKSGVVKLERRGADLYVNGKKVELYLSKPQKKGNTIVGNDLRKDVAKRQVLSATILDYLLKLENQHLIPEEWKGKAIFFWGTIYRSADGNLYVRCLCWDGDGWVWHYRWLGHGFRGYNPAAVSAS
jgi:hypothetical protein